MKITLKEAVDNFRKQWNWIADETLKRKRQVKEFEYFDEQVSVELSIPYNECYLCQFSGVERLVDQCTKCPVEWSGEIGNCYDKDALDDHASLYGRWEMTTDYIEAANLAREIANLPLKKQYQEEYENAID